MRNTPPRPSKLSNLLQAIMHDSFAMLKQLAFLGALEGEFKRSTVSRVGNFPF
jgi:hypothetical protein